MSVGISVHVGTLGRWFFVGHGVETALLAGSGGLVFCFLTGRLTATEQE